MFLWVLSSFADKLFCVLVSFVFKDSCQASLNASVNNSEFISRVYDLSVIINESTTTQLVNMILFIETIS